MSWSSSFFRYSKATLFFIARFGSVISLGNALALLTDPDEQRDTMLALSFAMPVALLAVITSQYHSYHQKDVDAWYKHAVIAIQASLMGLIREAGAYTAIRFLLTLPIDDNLWYTWIKFALASGAGLAALGISLYETNTKPATLEIQLTQQFNLFNDTIHASAININPETKRQLLDSFKKVLAEIHNQGEVKNISAQMNAAFPSVNYV